MHKPHLTNLLLQIEAATFARRRSGSKIPRGVRSTQVIATYLKDDFQEVLAAKYVFERGMSDEIAFPGLDVIIQATSIYEPRSPYPFKTARQQIFGLGRAVLVFVYDKTVDEALDAEELTILHAAYVAAHRTGDFILTRILRDVLAVGGNAEDLAATMRDRFLRFEDESEEMLVAEELLQLGCQQGYLPFVDPLHWHRRRRRMNDFQPQDDGVVVLSGGQL